MAEHVAEQIVVNAKALLTGLTTTSTRVFDSLVYPVQDGDLPCLKIDQGDENDAVVTMHSPALIERVMELLVVACVKQTTNYRRDANRIRKEVEIAIAGAQTLSGVCKTVIPVSCELELSGDAEKPIAEATMKFAVKYWTAYNAPDVPV